MATSIAAPNLHRVSPIDFEFSYDSEGIISVIDDLVERVMSVHMKKGLAIQASIPDSPQEEVVSFPAHTSYGFFHEEKKEAEEAAA
jgi:hypothetical protein